MNQETLLKIGILVLGMKISKNNPGYTYYSIAFVCLRNILDKDK
jgi:hypothetical protein